MRTKGKIHADSNFICSDEGLLISKCERSGGYGMDGMKIWNDAEANAQHIVTMWNNWSEVIEALELAKKQISDLDDDLNQSNHKVFGWHLNGDVEVVSTFFEENDCGAIEAIDAILSKVKEGETK